MTKCDDCELKERKEHAMYVHNEKVYIVGGYTLVFEAHVKLGNLQCKYNFNRKEVLLMMKENIKTNQIGKVCLGDIICT